MGIGGVIEPGRARLEILEPVMVAGEEFHGMAVGNELLAQLVNCLEHGRVVGAANDFVKRAGQPGWILQEVLELEILAPVEEGRMVRLLP